MSERARECACVRAAGIMSGTNSQNSVLAIAHGSLFS